MNSLGIIQARLGSKRLRGKALLDVGDEKVIYHCYNAAKNSKVLDQIIVATTTEKEDDELVEYLKYKKIKYFRGEKDNVYSRFYKIIQVYEPQFIARLTGDNPLIDSDVIAKVVKTHIENDSEYTSNTILRTWPRGNDIECVSSNLMKSLNKKNLSLDELEHVTLYIKKNLYKYKHNSVENDTRLIFPQLRLTLDYIEDYKLIRKLYNLLQTKKLEINAYNIDSLVVENPSLMNINKNRHQNKIDGVQW